MSREVPVRFREGPGVRFPRATRLVICCRGTAEQALSAMQNTMQKLKLTVNETKTHICRVPAETFDFLGYTLGRCYSPRTGRAFISVRPSKQKILRLCRAISEQTSSRWEPLAPEEMVDRLNRIVVGWANYFSLGSVSPAYRAVDRHARTRLRQWLCRKHKVLGRGTTRFPLRYIYDTLRLVELQRRPHRSLWAKA